jgi:hypothetical protein
MSENVILTNNLKKLQTLRSLSATASCVAAIGFAFDIYILITAYHPANRLFQIACLPLYALGACVFFLRYRFYSAQTTTVIQSTNRTE